MRHIHRATVIVTALIAALLLFVAGAALRLTMGPISLGVFSQSIEDVLNRSVAGAVIRFDQVVLEWSQPDHRINVIVLGAKIFDLDGHIIAQAPKADVNFDAVALLSGHVKVTNFGLIGLQLTGMRTQDGSIRLGFGRDQSQANFLDALRKILQDTSSGGGGLQSLSLQHARVAFMDEPTGLFVVLPDAGLELKSRSPGFDATLIAAAEISGSPFRVEIRAALRDDGTPSSAKFRMTGFSLHSLSENGSHFAVLKPYAIIGNIAGDATFAENGRATAANLQVAGGGVLSLPSLGDVQVSHFDFQATIDPLQRRAVFSSLNFDARDASFRGNGDLEADWDEMGIAKIAAGLDARAVRLNAPRLFPKALAIVNSSVHLSYDRDTHRIAWERTVINTGPIAAELSGEAFLGDSGVQNVTVNGTAAEMSVGALLSFWPADYAEGAREWIAANIPQGQVGPLRIAAALPPGALDQPWLADSALEVSFPLQSLTTSYVRGMTPMTGASGDAVLRGDSFRARIGSAMVGPLALSAGEITIPDLHLPGTTAHITAHAEGTTADILRLIDEQPLGYPKRFGVNPATVEGHSSVDLDFKLPMLRDLRWDQVGFGVHAKSTGLGLPVGGRKLDGADADIVVGPSSLTATGSGRFAAVPVNFKWTENFESSAKSTRLDVSGRADDAERARLGVSLPSWITGPAPFSVTLNGQHFRFAEGALNADLTNVAIDFPGLAVRKAAGTPATAAAQVAFDSAGVISLPDFTMHSDAINLRGALAMAEGGKMRSLSLSEFRAGGDDFALTVIPSEKAPVITIQGASLDIRHFTGLDKTTPSPPQNSAPAQDPIAIRAQVQRLVLSQRAALRDVALSIALGANNRLNAFDLEAAGPGKSMLSGHMSVVKGVRTLDLASDNAGALIDSLFNFQSVRDGKIAARIEFPEPGITNRTMTPPDYQGTVTLTNIVMTDQPFLARLFAAGSLDGPLRLLQGQGISLANVAIPFSARGHVYMIAAGRASGESIGGTFTGVFDRESGKVDVSGTLVPIFGLNSVLGSIPVLGDLLVSKKGEGILGLTYQMKGNIAEPAIMVNPLSMFTPGILRRIFEFSSPKDAPPSTPAPSPGPSAAN